MKGALRPEKGLSNIEEGSKGGGGRGHWGLEVGAARFGIGHLILSLFYILSSHRDVKPEREGSEACERALMPVRGALKPERGALRPERGALRPERGL